MSGQAVRRQAANPDARIGSAGGIGEPAARAQEAAVLECLKDRRPLTLLDHRGGVSFQFFGAVTVGRRVGGRFGGAA